MLLAARRNTFGFLEPLTSVGLSTPPKLDELWSMMQLVEVALMGCGLKGFLRGSLIV